MKYQVIGRDHHAGRRLRMTISAPDETHVRLAAEKRGLDIETITTLPDESAPHAAPAVHEPPAPEPPASSQADDDLAALGALAGNLPITSAHASHPAYAAAPTIPAYAPEPSAPMPAYASEHTSAPAYAGLRIVAMALIVIGWVILGLGLLASLGVFIASLFAGAAFSPPARGMSAPPLGAGVGLGLFFAIYILVLTVPGSLFFLGLGLGLRALRDIARNTFITAHR